MPVRGNIQVVQKLTRALTSIIPKRIGADAERHFKDSFRKQGFTDASFRMWPPLKDPKAKKGRILKKTGLLMNSIRVAHADWRGVQVVAGGPHVPYAQIHNEGGTINRQVTRRAHFRKGGPVRSRRGTVQRKAGFVKRHQAHMNVHIRKRQFMGPSKVLETKMRGTILRTIAEAVK